MERIVLAGGFIGISSYFLYTKYFKEKPELFQSISDKKFEIVKQLISEQENPKEFITKSSENIGYSLTHILCKNGNLEIIKFLHSIAGDEIFFKRSSDGWFPLNIAIFNQNEEIIPFILSISDPKNKHLDDAEHSSLTLSVIQKNSNILKLLIEFYEKNNVLKEIINYPNFKKQTPLYFACFLGDVDCAKILLEKGAFPKSADFRGNSPLHAACMSVEGEKTLSLLLNEKLNFNQKKTDGCTPLHVACIKGVKEAVVKLLKKGVDVYAMDSFGSTPLQHSIVHKRHEIIPMFFEFDKLFSMTDNDGFTPLFTACNYLRDEYLLEEISKKSDIHYVDDFGSNALHCACSSSNFVAVQILVEKFKISLSQRNNKGNSPFNCATNVEIQEYLKKFCEPEDLLPGKPKEIVQETIEVLKEASIEYLGELLKSDTFKNIILLTGAGISTNAAIPDFRSPNTGLYDKIRKEFKDKDIKLTPESVFDINTFKEDPKIFYSLAGDILKSSNDVEPTKVHQFIKYLSDKKILLRNYTQNIDGLERKIGIPEELLVECHGTLQVSHCLNPNCKKEFKLKDVQSMMEKSTVPKCDVCDSVVKPDLVFFGESLPDSFGKNLDSDFKICDLLIVIGTSLTVFPFSTLPGKVGKTVPRVLINKKVVGDFKFPSKIYINRDIVIDTDCDEAISTLNEIITKK
jgi:NAD+-dependent protein deacetylase sirtuin 2